MPLAFKISQILAIDVSLLRSSPQHQCQHELDAAYNRGKQDGKNQFCYCSPCVASEPDAHFSSLRSFVENAITKAKEEGKVDGLEHAIEKLEKLRDKGKMMLTSSTFDPGIWLSIVELNKLLPPKS